MGAKKEERRHTTVPHAPAKGPQDQRMADAPRFHGERSVSTASCVSRAMRLRLAVCEKAEPTIARRSNCQCGWEATFKSHSSPVDRGGSAEIAESLR